MKHYLLAMIMALPVFCVSQYTYQHLEVDFLQDQDKLKIYTYQNLRLYPVYAKESFERKFNAVGKYKPLQDAIEKKKVIISEQDENGTVNTVVIENISSDTIIVVMGDVIKGGKQDRIINRDVLLPPKSGKKQLPVYCVESGRWSAGDNQRFSSRNNTRNNESVAVAKNAANFKSYEGKGTVSLRKVIKDHDQSKVWEEVDRINEKNKTSTSTKTYTAIKQSQELNSKLNGYMQFFRNKFSDKRIIGFIAVSGNRVSGTELFATHDLFAGQFESLLSSYATEAIMNGSAVAIDSANVKAYADKLFKNEEEQSKKVKDNGSTFTEKGRKLKVSILE